MSDTTDGAISKLLYENPDWSNRKIAKHAGVDEATVRRALKRFQIHRKRIPVDYVERFHYDLDRPLHLDWEHCAITADWHIPLYNPHLINQFLDDCKQRNIRHLIIGGDFLNGDALSQYFPKQESAGLDKELNEARAVMGVLAQNFDQIVYVNGNHDYRYVKSRGYALGFVECMKEVFGHAGESVLEKLVFTNLDHCYVGTSKRVLVCHPKAYNRFPLTTARALAAKHPDVDIVVTAHSHHWGITKGPDGQTILAECGGFFDRHKTAYLQQSTTYPHWVNGWLRYSNGKLSGWSEGVELG